MKRIFVMIFIFCFTSGCSEEGFEYSSMRFALEQGFKSSCDGEPRCIEKFEGNLERCLLKDDIQLLVNTPTSEIDARSTEISLKVMQCIDG